MTVLITGGAGFIGSNFIQDWFIESDEQIINLDKLTYAGNLKNLASIPSHKKCVTIKGDICDMQLVSDLLNKYSPRAIIHFAAETHVDKSINRPEEFINTNIIGTFHLLNATNEWFKKQEEDKKNEFRFLHISTDEVYGSLNINDKPFTEESTFKPNNPYAASKAASDHIARSYFQTYNLPVMISHSSNNYGPNQFPEKLIPLMIHQAIKGEKLPIYGDGQHIRDWVHVSDHCAALRLILKNGELGETYNIGGNCEKTNLNVIHHICEILDRLHPKSNGQSYQSQISFIQDRMGHDKRYSISTKKIEKELGWVAKHNFSLGLEETVKIILQNEVIS
jgi:dTDP-glucose 4,6-dehydratase